MTRRILLKKSSAIPRGAIIRQNPGTALGLEKTTKSKLKSKKVKGIKIPGRQPKNYKS